MNVYWEIGEEIDILYITQYDYYQKLFAERTIIYQKKFATLRIEWRNLKFKVMYVKNDYFEI